MNDLITNVSKQLISSRLASWWTIRGCSDYEIRQLEIHFDINLPIIYKDFLKKMGKKAGKFMQGTDMFYEHLFYNREALEDVLNEDDYPFVLEKDVFVFSSHQGYIFHFFNTIKDTIDPPVYGYKEGDLSMKRIDNSFSSFLSETLEEEIKGWSFNN